MTGKRALYRRKVCTKTPCGVLCLVGIYTYRQNGFEGLKPRARHYYQKGNLPDNYKELVQEAIQLRREVPSRSVEKIILILEMEKRVAQGF